MASFGPTISQINVALSRLEKVILETLDFEEVVQNVVDSIFKELGYLHLGYNIAVLALIDHEKKVLKRISISQTKEAEKGVKGLPVSFHNLDIPLSEKGNYSIKAVNNKKIYITHDWYDLLRPQLTSDEARALQKSVGIQTSIIFPLVVHTKAIGLMIFSTTRQKNLITDAEKELLLRFTNVVALAVQNARLYSSVEESRRNLRLANIRLKQLDKLKDEFVSLASHELRTPLTVIKSYLSLLHEEHDGKLNEQQRIYTQRAFDATSRLNRLVTEMLDVSRIESGRLILNTKDTEIGVIVQNIVNEMMPKAQEQQIELGIDSQLGGEEIVHVDEERIGEVLINLIGNAIKYTSGNGKINIKLLKVENNIHISISDTGIGIKESDLGKLFQKFGVVGGDYAHKNNIPSTGLGLYLSKTIIERHGGKIWAESKGEGKGSTFTFSIPAVEKK